jgi:isopropylmalate/homocitrate/citramalate synthase
MRLQAQATHGRSTQMATGDSIEVAQHLESMGVHIVRDGFASWVRRELGFAASDEHLERALVRVQSILADGRAATLHDLTATIAAEMPVHSQIDAFGGSAWAMD